MSNTKVKNKIYIGLGSNKGDRLKNLIKATRELQKIIEIQKISDIFESEPFGYKNQNDFYNLAIKAQTDLAPSSLLKKLAHIETKMGRKRIIKNGPRIIDLDILFYNKESINTINLKIPHPELHKRNFVMLPMNQIAPNLKHPTINKTINVLLKQMPKQGQIRKIPKSLINEL